MSPSTAILGLSLPEISLLFFFGLFVGMVIWLVLSKSSRWSRDSRIPLEETPIDDAQGTLPDRSSNPHTTRGGQTDA